jgi:hypothetical protein
MFTALSPSVMGCKSIAAQYSIVRLVFANIRDGRYDRIDAQVFHAPLVVLAFLQGSHASAQFSPYTRPVGKPLLVTTEKVADGDGPVAHVRPEPSGIVKPRIALTE